MIKPISKLIPHSSRYETLILIFVVLALLIVIGVWAWFGHKTNQMELEILKQTSK